MPLHFPNPFAQPIHNIVASERICVASAFKFELCCFCRFYGLLAGDFLRTGATISSKQLHLDKVVVK